MKVYLDSVGCKLNQAEIESMARQFRAAGHEVVALAEAADMAVVNTCAVTAGAAAESRSRIRRVSRLGRADIVATGCWSSLQPFSAAALQNVARVVKNDEKDNLVAAVLDLPPCDFDLQCRVRQPLPGLRHRTRAFIKVQDGCDNHCTFCVTAVARGKGRSRLAQDVLLDILAALNGGTQEIVLSGVHLGSWGKDLGLHLRDLVEAVLRETAIPRLRLSSLEPWDLDADFLSLWGDPRLCPHLHLPLQSGCATTLRRMARKTTPVSFRKLVDAGRRVVPDMAITTDVIAGFPGETEAEFEESLDFVRQLGLAGGHAFTYSPRPGTAAARFRPQVPAQVRRERNAAYRAAFENASRSYAHKFIGRTEAVLWESVTQIGERAWEVEGLTGQHVRVRAETATPRWNEIDPVRLVESGGNGLIGEIQNTGQVSLMRSRDNLYNDHSVIRRN